VTSKSISRCLTLTGSFSSEWSIYERSGSGSGQWQWKSVKAVEVGGSGSGRRTARCCLPPPTRCALIILATTFGHTFWPPLSIIVLYMPLSPQWKLELPFLIPLFKYFIYLVRIYSSTLLPCLTIFLLNWRLKKGKDRMVFETSVHSGQFIV